MDKKDRGPETGLWIPLEEASQQREEHRKRCFLPVEVQQAIYYSETGETPQSTQEVYNILASFCRDVRDGKTPHSAVIDFVAWVLEKVYPAKYNAAMRAIKNRAIKQRYEELRSQGHRIRGKEGDNYGEATEQIAKEFGIRSKEYAIERYYADEPDCPVFRFLLAKEIGRIIEEKYLQEVQESVRKVAVVILAKSGDEDAKTGGIYRSMLGIEAYRYRPNDARDEAIAQEARAMKQRGEKYINKRLAEGYIESEENIKKIITRKNRGFEKQINEAVRALLLAECFASASEARSFVMKIFSGEKDGEN